MPCTLYTCLFAAERQPRWVVTVIVMIVIAMLIIMVTIIVIIMVS